MWARQTASGRYDPFIFEQNLDASDVEIVDEVVILKAEEARKHVEPPRLEKLLLSPDHVYLRPGEKQTFRPLGIDQYEREIEAGDIVWAGTGGRIDTSGLFTAGEDEGGFLVTGTCGNFKATATVHITEDKANEISPAHSKGSISWTGEVPPQKWTNLYVKVLTKLVSAGEVKLQLTIEASPREGVSDQLVEEAKIGLRGLGLGDDIQTH